MTQPDITETLHGIHFLRDLPHDLIAHLASVSQFVEFPPSTVIFRQGDAASTLYLVVLGNISLEICGSLVSVASEY